MKALLILLFVLAAAGVSAHTALSGEVAYSFSPHEPPRAGTPSTIHFFVDGALDVVHERQLHVFIVGEDMRTFAHIHPEDFPDGMGPGEYRVHYPFPYAGNYALIIDYSRENVGHLGTAVIQVDGSAGFPRQNPEPVLSKRYGNYSVTLKAPDLTAGEEAELTYVIERDGLPVRDLQQYLGSEIHVLAIRDDLTNAGHTHAYSEHHAGHTGGMQMHFGPTVPVRYAFPAPGNYTLFGQFKAGDDVVTTDFVVTVQQTPAGNFPWALLAAISLLVLACIASALKLRRRK